jgi:uncharacterized protein
MSELLISMKVARRFVLGRQGLWPGRRWAGKAGTAQALRQMEALQIDPLNVVARNHDLTLLSRVTDYRSEYLGELMYQERAFFDYGGTVFIRPMSELPYWRLVMRQKGREERWAKFAAQQPETLTGVKRELRTRGPVGNRDLDGQKTRVGSFRSGKDTGLALYYLWLTGELMTHHREGFDRIYDFRQNIAPPELNYAATVAEAERFLILKQIAFLGFCRQKALMGWLERRTTAEESARWAKRLSQAGEILPIAIEGRPDPYYVLAADGPLLTTLNEGHVPQAWQPLGPTSQAEVTFLAPLDIVSTRGRAKILFEFDYIWEVYKPADQRRWGYYTLPILYGDQLVARLDPKFDRETGTLMVKGFWLEQKQTGRSPEFAEALAHGLKRLVKFLGAQSLNVSAIQPAALRKHIQAAVAQ